MSNGCDGHLTSTKMLTKIKRWKNIKNRKINGDIVVAAGKETHIKLAYACMYVCTYGCVVHMCNIHQ